jgi:hypothetical protein
MRSAIGLHKIFVGGNSSDKSLSLSHFEVFERDSESARANIRAVALHTRMKGRSSVVWSYAFGHYKQLGNVGLEAVLVDSEALDL